MLGGKVETVLILYFEQRGIQVSTQVSATKQDTLRCAHECVVPGIDKEVQVYRYHF